MHTPTGIEIVDKHDFADGGRRRFTPPVQAVPVVDEGAIDR
jgi:hypothetical protein